MTSYHANTIKELKSALAALRKKGVDVDQYIFDGPSPPPQKIRAPSFADSKFQQEQAFGDWAENTLAAAINANSPHYRAIHYGFSSKTIAGEPGFKEEYEAGIRDTCEWGKRADLLLVPTDLAIEDDVSHMATGDLQTVVGASVGAIEVRSSRMELAKHATYVKGELAKGKKVSTPELSFTVKVEDLAKVIRWIQVHDRPQVYAQVLLDTVHVIGVAEIISYLSTAEKIEMMNPKRSGKETIKVPLSKGHEAGKIVEYPELHAIDRIAKNGRHDWFIRPEGGKIEVDPCVFLEAMTGSRL